MSAYGRKTRTSAAGVASEPAGAARGLTRRAAILVPRDAVVHRRTVPDDLRTSEVYRGHTIYYSPATRTWIVGLRPGTPSDHFASAFQARRAVNLLLDGTSVSWPKRSP
jgi:hypothetical protein